MLEFRLLEREEGDDMTGTGLEWGTCSALRTLLIGGLAFALASCVSAPPAEEYFDKRTPENVIDAFRYAIATDQRSFAYDCLNAETREETSPSHFLLLRWNEAEGVSYHDLIALGQRDEREPVAGDRGIVHSYFEGPNDQGLDIHIPLDVVVERDPASGQWSIDLLSTLGLH